MNEANEIHRDIYVGMVAEEMAASGYYGEDVTIYCFLENGMLHSFTDAKKCAIAYLRILATGVNVSGIISAHKHCDLQSANKAEIITALENDLCNDLKNNSIKYIRRSVDIQPLRIYLKTLPQTYSYELECALLGILTLPTFSFNHDEQVEIYSIKQYQIAPQINRHFFGYYQKQGSIWKPILNGDLPTILDKWLAAANNPITPILPMYINSTKPIFQLYDDFTQILANTMDDGYLAMLDALYASQA